MMALMAVRLICSGRCCKIPALRRPGRPGLGGHRVAANIHFAALPSEWIHDGVEIRLYYSKGTLVPYPYYV